MNDFDYDSICKKRLARNAYNHVNYRRGKMKLPHEFLTKKEREALNGEVKAYRLNEPMRWSEFRSMPDDIQAQYIRALRDKFHASDRMLAEMFGVSFTPVNKVRTNLGIKDAKKLRPSQKQLAAWNIWRAGAVNTEPITEEGSDKNPDCEEKSETPVETNVPVLTPVTPPAGTCCAPPDVGAVESYRVSFRMVHSWDEFCELCSQFPFPAHPAQISLEVW